MNTVNINNILTNGQVLYIGQQPVTDTNIPNAQYGTYSATADQIANGSSIIYSVPTDNTNLILYFWGSTGSVAPLPDAQFQGAIMLNASSGSVQLVNSSFSTIFGQSDNSQVWSIINSTIISINNQSGQSLFVSYDDVAAGASTSRQRYPWPGPNPTTLTNGATLSINLAYPGASSTTVVNTNTFVALYTGNGTGAVPTYLAIFNNALGTLINSSTNDALIITRTSTNNYQVTVAASSSSSGLPWWGWLLIIAGILLLIVLLLWVFASTGSSSAKYTHVSTVDGYQPLMETTYMPSATGVVHVSPAGVPPSAVPGQVIYPSGYVPT